MSKVSFIVPTLLEDPVAVDDVADFRSLESVENFGDKGIVRGLDEGWTSMGR